MRRPCPTPDCPELLTRGTKCPRCYNPIAERAYREEHREERTRWAPIVARGKTPCRRCRSVIKPGQPWDIGKPDDHCDYPTAPEHTACNRATMAH